MVGLNPRRVREREPVIGDRAARRAAALSVALGCAYLIWLALGGVGSPWLFGPFVVLEIWGVGQFLLRATLTWQHVPEHIELDQESRVDRPVDLVVTCTFQTAEDLERTLVSCRSVRHAARTTVALQTDRAELLEVTQMFDVDVIVTGGNHVDAFWAAARTSEFAMWLIAGQVPAPGCIETMISEFEDASVAFVQAEVGMLNTDSFAHLRGGRDEEAFHSRVIQPILGSRGAASWRGGGSMVRMLAIASSGGLDSNDQAALERSVIRLQAGGWTSRYCGNPVLVHSAAPDSLGAYLMLRRRSAIELLRVFKTDENPLRHRGLSRRQRLDHVALAAGFASSVRQLGLTLVLTVILFTGAVPFGGSTTAWAAIWVPLQLATMRANRLLARGTMQRGDWTRQAWRTLAADLNAFATVLGLRRSVATFYRTSGSGFGAIEKMRFATIVLLLLDVAVAVRGLTLVWPRILPRFSMSGRIMALGLGVLVVLTIVDVLQVAVRRRQRRATFRLSTNLVAIIEGQLVHVVDLAVAGLGAQIYASECRFDVGQAVPIILRVPMNSGEEQKLELVGEVRSVVEREDHYRIGVAFGELPRDVRTGLISYCAVGHHEIKGRESAEHDVHPSRFEVPVARSNLTKLCSAGAMLIGVAVFFAGPAAPGALADVVAPVSVCLESSTGAPLAGGTVGFEYDELWHTIGSTADDGCVVGQMPGKKTKVEMVHRGVRRVVRQNLAKNPTVQFQTEAIEVSLASSDGTPLEGGVVEFRSAGEWRTVGSTDSAGVTTTELLTTRRRFAMTVDGVRVERTFDLKADTRVEFAMVPVEISLNDPSGVPIPDAAVEYRGAEWIPLGLTDDDGVVRIELLPGRVRFSAGHEGGRATMRQDLAIDTAVRFATTQVTVDFRTSEGVPIAGALVEAEGDDWTQIGRTNDAGVLALDLLPQNRWLRITYEGRRHRIRQDLAVDPLVEFRTIRAGVEVATADGVPLEGVLVQMRGGSWIDLGATDESGLVEAELLPVKTKFRVHHDGLRNVTRWDLAVDPVHRVSTVPTVVQVVGRFGDPVVGTEVEVRTRGWNSVGFTDENGEVSGEFLPTTIRFRSTHGGERHVVRADTATSTSVTIVVPAEQPVVNEDGIGGELDDEGEIGDVADAQADADGEATTGDPQAPLDVSGSSELSAPIPDTTTNAPTVTTIADDASTTTAGPPPAESTTNVPATVTTLLSAPPSTTEASTSTVATLLTTSPAESTSAAVTTVAVPTTATAAPTAAVSTTVTSAVPTSSSDPVESITTIGAARSLVELAPAASPTSTQADTGASSLANAEPEPLSVEQAVAGATVLAARGEVFESETVATPLSWSSPDIESGRVLEVSLEEAAVYGSLGDASSVGYAFRIDNPTDTDLASNAVVELHLPGAVELAPEAHDHWSCDASGATWRCEHNGSLLADSSSIIRVAAIVPEPEVIGFVAGDRSEDLVVLAVSVTAMLGALYLVMHVVGGRRDDGGL